MQHKTSRPLWKMLGLGLAAAMLAGAGSAQANTITFDFEEFTGTDSQVQITLDDSSGASIEVSAQVLNPSSADIRAIFFNLVDGAPSLSDSDFAGLNISDVSNDPENELPNDAQLTGGSISPDPRPFDYGVLFGTTGDDGLLSVSFLINNQGGALGLNDFGAFGVRLKSVGANGEGSSKLIGDSPETPDDDDGLGGTVEVPAPNVLALMALGLLMIGFGWATRRRI